MNITSLGILFLGVIVGSLLGWALRKVKKPSLKIASNVLGVALTGTPVLFMSGVGPERWMYPIGIVVGLFSSRLGGTVNVISRGQTRSGKSAWYVAVFEATCFVLMVGAAIFVAILAGRAPDQRESVRGVLRSEMPCRWAWAYLGRYSVEKHRYEVPASFDYADSTGPREPIPQVGDSIVITGNRNFIIVNYAQSAFAQKCSKMLDPPVGYRPENAAEYEAGKIPNGVRFVVNKLELLPSPGAEPEYVWALIGPAG